jgi:hypothetical protein
MENISKNTPPKKRGRPPTIPAWELRLNRDVYERRSPRHLNNTVYKTRAIHLVHHDPRFAWLCSDEATIMQGKGHMRHTILAELGRIEDEAAREAMALYLCAHKPPTRQAIALIRQYRLGTRPPGSVVQLADVISRAVATYQAEYRPLSDDEVSQALHDVAHEILMARDKHLRGVPVPALMEEYGSSRASVFRYLRSEQRGEPPPSSLLPRPGELRQPPTSGSRDASRQ